MNFRYYTLSIVETQYGADEMLVAVDIITGATEVYTGKEMEDILSEYEAWVTEQDEAN